MKIITTIKEIKHAVSRVRAEGRIIGFVPTMGFLHDGHLSLVLESVKQTDYTVVSIFLNPTQFAPHEDFEDYPRDMQRDLDLLEKEGTNLVFIPAAAEMYPQGYKTYVEVHDLQDKLCGVSRPVFFRGISTIVLKLFHIVNPDVAFFGQKDAQQAIILKKMVQDLDMDVQIEVLPVIREKDGLALSSRNYYFNPGQRKEALCLSKSLKKAQDLIAAGEEGTQNIIQAMKAVIEAEPLAKIDYVEIVDSEDLSPLETVKKGCLIALAVYIDKVRLIDNIIVE